MENPKFKEVYEYLASEELKHLAASKNTVTQKNYQQSVQKYIVVSLLLLSSIQP